jgi:hypothetical protein
VQSSSLQIYGTYTGPSNAGFSVNGVRALTNANSFALPRLQLDLGLNTLKFRSATLDGAPTIETRTITYTPPTSAPSVLLAARSPGDYAPVRMPFILATKLPAGQTVITRVQVDYNGDGLFEVDSASPVNLEYAYETPGLYAAKARVSFDDGNSATPLVVIEDTTRVLIQSLAFTRQSLCRVYDAMKARLAQNQITSALNTLAPELRPRFQTVWTQYQSSGALAQAITKLGPIVDGDLSRNAAELRVAILTSNPLEVLGYTILFRRDIDGVWRIEWM